MDSSQNMYGLISKYVECVYNVYPGTDDLSNQSDSVEYFRLYIYYCQSSRSPICLDYLFFFFFFFIIFFFLVVEEKREMILQ